MVERQIVARGHQAGAEHPSCPRGQARPVPSVPAGAFIPVCRRAPRMLLADVRMGRVAFPGKLARLPEH